MHADNRMHPHLAEFAEMLLGTGVVYEMKLLGSKELTKLKSPNHTPRKNQSEKSTPLVESTNIFHIKQ